MGLQKVGMKNLALKIREIGGSRNRGREIGGSDCSQCIATVIPINIIINTLN